MVTVSSDEATDCALVTLLNGDACVPELLSLPVGETYQVAAVAETVSSANSAARVMIDFIFIWGVDWVLGWTNNTGRRDESVRHGVPKQRGNNAGGSQARWGSSEHP